MVGARIPAYYFCEPIEPRMQQKSLVPVNPGLGASPRQKEHQEDDFESKNASGMSKSKPTELVDNRF